MNVGGYSSFRVLLVLMLSMLCLPASAQTVVEYVHTDVLGSIVAISDTSGGLIGQRRVYEPYGSQIEPSMQDGPGYTGHVQDTGTGLVYMQQRYYDPGIGRFLSVDPVAAYDEPVKLFNRYRYGANNPYRFTDPDGRVDWDMFGDSFKIEGSLGMSLEA